MYKGLAFRGVLVDTGAETYSEQVRIGQSSTAHPYTCLAPGAQDRSMGPFHLFIRALRMPRVLRWVRTLATLLPRRRAIWSSGAVPSRRISSGFQNLR